MTDLSIMTAAFLNDVADEIKKARERFPDNKHMYAALAEEFGEVGNALIENDLETKVIVTDLEIWKECVQTATMALRVAVEGDPSFSYQPPELEDLRT